MPSHDPHDPHDPTLTSIRPPASTVDPILPAPAYSYARSAQSDPMAVAAQHALNRSIAERDGYVIVAAFTDDGVSGTSRDRPGLSALLRAAAQSAPARCPLYVTDMARLTRAPEFGDTWPVVERLRRLGVRVRAAERAERADIGTGATLADAFASCVAECARVYERRALVARLAAGRRRRAQT